MYSYEDRIRAVERYIELGKRVQATIRQLGYPTKNALKAWCREYEKRCDLPIGFRRKPKYSPEQKVAAVDHYVNHGRCITATSKALGYPYRMLLRDRIHELHPELCKRAVGGVAAYPRPPELKQTAVIALCTRQGKAEANLVQLEESATRKRGPRFYETSTQSAGRRGKSPVGTGDRVAQRRSAATAA